MKIRTRFAPSPTGYMHIGNLRTCLYGYLFAKKNNGEFILRIEDTDQERYVDGAIDTIYRTLNLAGITFDEGPDNPGKCGPYIQSQRKEIYKKYAEKLIELGGAYRCFCTKEELEEMKDDKGIRKYNKKCMHLSKEEIEEKLKNNTPYVIRQNIPLEGISTYHDMVFGDISVPNIDMEDNILLKSDGMPTYNFANVVDDHLMGITHVMRGMEYLSSTPKYNLIYDSFGWQRPKYIHLPPIMKDEKRKLSKRHGDANFEDFYQKGYLPEAIVNYIALLGWHPNSNKEKMTMQEMIELFDVSGISRSGAIFDEMKMAWLNSEYIKALELNEFINLSKPYYNLSEASKHYKYEEIAPILKTRIDKFSQIKEKIDFICDFKEYDYHWFENKKNKVNLEVAEKILEELIKKIKNIKDFTEENMKNEISKLCEEKSYKNGQVFLTMRLAVTGYQSTSGGATEVAHIIGKEETIKRMEFSLELLKNRNEK